MMLPTSIFTCKQAFGQIATLLWQVLQKEEADKAQAAAMPAEGELAHEQALPSFQVAKKSSLPSQTGIDIKSDCEAKFIRRSSVQMN